ncbi:MAG: hypothetical protein ABI718_15555, partial [Acidobacteriota bacterium]
MSLYDQREPRLRDAPSAGALIISSTAAFLTGAAAAPLVLTIFDTLLALLSSWHGALVFYGPLARPFSSGFYEGLHSPWYELSQPSIALASLAFGLFLVYAWPSEQTLATKLFVDGLAMSMAVFGCIAPALDPSNMRSAEAHFGTSSLLCSVLLVLIGSGVILIIERQAAELMTNVFTLTFAGQRFLLWFRRIPLPVAIVAALCFGNGYWRGMAAWGIVLVVTLLESVGHRPEHRFEKLERVHLREARFTMPLIAAVALGGSVLLFG